MKISSGTQPYLLSLDHKQTVIAAGDKKLSITNPPGSRKQTGQGSSAENFSKCSWGRQALYNCSTMGKLFLLQGNCLPIN